MAAKYKKNLFSKKKYKNKPIYVIQIIRNRQQVTRDENNKCMLIEISAVPIQNWFYFAIVRYGTELPYHPPSLRAKYPRQCEAPMTRRFHPQI